MIIRWLDTTTSAEAEARASAFWSAMRTDVNSGAFWADRIKAFRGDAPRRLELAMDHLPLPRAFSEAALALRAQIRAKRKTRESFQDDLSLLYWLAAIRS